MTALFSASPRLRVISSVRIPIQPKRRKKLQALDPVLQLLGDLLGAGDDVVHLQQTLFFGGVEGERHDQGVRQRFQSDRLDLRHVDLLGEMPQVLLRQLRPARSAARRPRPGSRSDLRSGHARTVRYGSRETSSMMRKRVSPNTRML